MNRLWVKAAFVVLLCLSLGLKAWGSTAMEQAGPAAISPAFTGQLGEMGFVFEEAASLDGPAIVATAQDCRIEVTTASPLGWHRAAIADLAQGQSVSYLYDGRLYDEQPVLLTKLAHYWYRLAGYFTAAQQPAVRVIITSSGCTSRSLDAGSVAPLLG